MTDQTDTEDERHQPQRSGLLPVASARRGVEHLLAEGVVTARFARARWPESVLVADLRLPLGTVEPEQRGDRALESGGVRRVVRYRLGVTGETARTVHVVPLPTDRQAGVVGALCGAALMLGDIVPPLCPRASDRAHGGAVWGDVALARSGAPGHRRPAAATHRHPARADHLDTTSAGGLPATVPRNRPFWGVAHSAEPIHRPVTRR